MTQAEVSCPTPEQITDLLANALPADQAGQLRQHIAGCPKCRARLLASRPTRARPDTAYDAGGELHRGDVPSPPAYLKPAREPGELGWLGGYRILAQLGAGGMGVVFEAEDVALQRRVALKVLPPELSSPQFRERFLREARAVAALSSDHIVTVYQVGEDDGVPFLAMELLRGESLEDRLQREGRLPLGEALNIARQAAQGLEAAHERGLTHRDVKPANLWLEAEGPSKPVRRVKVLDFGLARPREGSAITAQGMIVGTLGYMAPETVRGLHVDGRADLYGLGCVFYRMLSGRAPFEKTTHDTGALLRAVAEQGAPPPEELPDLPRPVAGLLYQLLARDPNDRPPSSRAVIDRLRALESGVSVADRPAPATLTFRRAAGPGGHRWLGWHVWAGAGAILAALLVAAVVGWSRYGMSGRAEEPDNGAGAPPGAPAPPIKVGVLFSHTGTLGVSEHTAVDAVLMAIDEINKSGGVLGRQVEPIIADGQSDELEFAARAEELLDREGLTTIFGCWTSSSRKRVAAVCERKHGLLLYPLNYEGLEQSPNVFYLGRSANQQLTPAARWAYAELGKRRFFLVGSEYVYSRVAHEVLKDELKRLGARVVGEQYVPLGGIDFGPIAEEIKKSRADMIFNTVDGTSNLVFFSALRSAGIRPDTIPTLWVWLTESELRAFSGRKMAGDYAARDYFQSLSGKVNRDFVARFRTRYGQTRPMTGPMQMAYVSVYLWKQAVEAAGTTELGPLRETLKHQSIEAPEGPVRIDPATQHSWHMARVCRITPDLHFQIVWHSPEPLPPEPYPPTRARAQWQKYLDDLHARWDGRWELHAH
jgi:urea transport system substrate-binding protein